MLKQEATLQEARTPHSLHTFLKLMSHWLAYTTLKFIRYSYLSSFACRLFISLQKEAAPPPPLWNPKHSNISVRQFPLV